MATKVGDHRRRHPIPLNRRNPFAPRDMGGSQGWRGPGWQRIRKAIIQRDGNRSTISGMTPEQADLTVDHIVGARYYDHFHMNHPSNLRTTDKHHNIHLDPSARSGPKKPRRGNPFL